MDRAAFNLNYSFGPDLREIPEDPISMHQYLAEIGLYLKKLQSDQPRLKVQLLGEIGSYARILGKPEIAKEALEKSLALIDEQNLGLNYWAVHTLRFGEVMRQLDQDLDAETAFSSVLELSNRDESIRYLADFALQHLGKLKFKQNQLKMAEDLFKQALQLREAKKDQQLIDSTRFALLQTQAAIRKNPAK